MGIKRIKSLFNRLTKKRRRVLLLLLLVIGIFLIWRFWFSSKKKLENYQVKRGDVEEILILSGEIKADEHANLQFQSSGELAWIGVNEGDQVKRGQVLAKLDTVSLYAAYEQAQADLRSAQATLDRVYDEVKGHETDESFSQKETRTAAEVARDKAYWALVAAQEALANATLKAPFDGIITQITNPFGGLNILSTQPQIEIVNPETIYFEVVADQNEVVEINKNQKVTIILDSFPEEEFQGTVSFIGYTPKADEVGTVYKVKVNFLEAKFDPVKYRIGMTGEARFVTQKKSDVLYLPPKFINSDSQGKYVYLGRKRKKVYIETGIEGEEKVEIVGGLKEGDLVYD